MIHVLLDIQLHSFRLNAYIIMENLHDDEGVTWQPVSGITHSVDDLSCRLLPVSYSLYKFLRIVRTTHSCEQIPAKKITPVLECRKGPVK